MPSSSSSPAPSSAPNSPSKPKFISLSPSGAASSRISASSSTEGARTTVTDSPFASR